MLVGELEHHYLATGSLSCEILLIHLAVLRQKTFSMGLDLIKTIQRTLELRRQSYEGQQCTELLRKSTEEETLAKG